MPMERMRSVRIGQRMGAERVLPSAVVEREELEIKLWSNRESCKNKPHQLQSFGDSQ